MFTKFRWEIPLSQMWKQLSQLPKVGIKFDMGSKSPQLVDKEEKYPLPNGNKGFAICPTGLTVSDAALSRRDKKIAQLYEQGASKRRIGVYLARWLGWACLLGAQTAHATPCTSPPTSAIGPDFSQCVCNLSNANPTIRYNTNTLFGTFPTDAGFCADTTDSTCTASPPPMFSTQTYFFKNNTETADYFSCFYTSNGGFSSPQNYTPTTPAAPATPAVAPASIYRVSIGTSAGFIFLLTLCGVGGSYWLGRKKFQIKE